MIVRSWKRGINLIYRSFYRATSNDIDNSILADVSACSGTTWHAGLPAKSLHTRTMFESFHKVHIPVWRKYHYMLYNNIMERNDGLHKGVNILLSKGVCNTRIDWDLNVFRSGCRIVKEIRANLFLHWIRHRLQCLPDLSLHPETTFAS